MKMNKIEQIVLDVLDKDEVQASIITAIIKSRRWGWTNKEVANAVVNHIKDYVAKSISDKIKYEWAAGKILSLLNPVKTLNEKEVENILNKEVDFDVFREEIILGKSVDKICNLAIKEGGK